jgi:hypothetical protein
MDLLVLQMVAAQNVVMYLVVYGSDHRMVCASLLRHSFQQGE